MANFNDEISADSYFMRRLAMARRAETLPASVQFDLARAQIPDDQLEQVLSEFGAQFGNGWGIADVANRLLSGQPDTAAVADITALQTNLKTQGYLPPGYNVTGTWDSQSYYALRQADRAAEDAQRAGRGLLSVPVATGMRLITDTLPSRVWQGIVGAAKGLIAQGEETTERVGLVGGLAGGAAIGAAVGSVVPGPGTAVGAGVGAVIGGVAGFAADFFGDEPEEEGQGGWENLLDALHPFNEYTQNKDGVHQFFEDLSFVGTAASLAAGVGIAARGVTGAIGVARGITGAPTVLPGASIEAGGAATTMPVLAGAAPMTVPGPSVGLAKGLFSVPEGAAQATGLIGQALRHPIPTGAVLGGFQAMGDPNAGIVDVLEGAAFGAAAGLAVRASNMFKLRPDGAGWVDSLRAIADSHTLMSRPIMQLANGLYTGMAAGSIGARLASGELFTEPVDPLTGEPVPAPTTIAKEIRETTPLTSGMEVPLLGDVVDIAAFILYPTQLLPVKARQIAGAMDRALGETGVRDLIHAVQLNSNLSLGKAREMVSRTFNEHPLMYTKMRVDGAVEMAVIADLNRRGVTEGANSISFRQGVADMRRLIKDEGAANKGVSPTLQKILGEHMSSAELMEAWAVHRLRSDIPFDQSVTNYMESEKFLLSWEADARKRGTLVTETGQGQPFLVPTQGGGTKYVTPVVVPSGYVQENQTRFLLAQLRRDRQVAQETVAAAERTIRGRMNPQELIPARASLEQAQTSLKTIDAQLAALEGTATVRKRAGEEVHIVPARVDTLTRTDIFSRKKEFMEIQSVFAERMSQVRKLEDTIGQDAYAQLGTVQQQYHYEVERLRKDGLITLKQREELLRRPDSKSLRKEISNSLEAQALVAARDVKLPAEQMQYLHERGYKPVVTGDEIFLTPQLDSFTEIMGIPKYRKIRGVVETLGLGSRNVKEADLGSLTNRYMTAEVDQLLAKEGVPLKGSDALRMLQRHLEKHNSRAVVDFPVLGPVATALKFKADIRRLSPGEVEAALGGVVGMDSRMANEVYRALKRGGGFGEDIQLRHPLLAARQLARGVRISGLPGAAQVIRTWHATTDPFAMKGDVLRKDLTYSPPVELAKGPERARVISEMRVAGTQAGYGTRQLRESERYLDILAEGMTRMRPDMFPMADDFYRRMRVGYRNEYIPSPNTLHQIKWAKKQPNTQRLVAIAKAGEPHKGWWTTSGQEIADMFDGGVTRLGDGSTISDARLMVNLIAATSYRAAPDVNVQFALKQLNAFKEGTPRPNQLEAPTKMLEEIFSGNTIDKWSPELRARYPVAVGKHENLTGNLDEITFDTVMERFMGMKKDQASPLIEATAQRLGWKNAEVQAAQWVAFKAESARLMEAERAAAIRRGDDVAAREWGQHVKAMKKATTYQEALHLPKATALYEQYLGNSMMSRTLQQVEDTVRGAVTFGPDYQSSIKLFSTAGYDTIVHEGAHLMRQILPENQVRWFEDHYGMLRQQGPEGASAEIRAIASEYHKVSGIPEPFSLKDQYPEVGKDRALRIADAFEHQRPTPNDPQTLAAYRAFAEESMSQYDVLTSRGFKMIPWAGKGQPYKNAAEFINDVRVNKRLYYFKTLQDDAFGTGKITQKQIDENPLLAYSGISVKDSAGKMYPQTYNDIFRAVHDIFAHSKEGVQTGARGEESAWRAHAAMYSEQARRAMTTETRGQNSWVNFGPHLRTGPEGAIPRAGEAGYVPPEQRPFSDQKVMLLPEEFSKIEDMRWTDAAEETFAEDFTAFMMGKYTGANEGAFGNLRGALATLWSRNRDAFLDAGVVPVGMARQFNDMFRDDFVKLGLRRSGSSFRSKQALAGATLGAIAGPLQGDQGWEDSLRGALFGAGIGYGVNKAVRKTYGYLPDALSNLNMTLRYTLSFTFDLGRFSEQNSIAAMKYGLPMFLSPKKHVMKGEWKSPYRDGPVTGEQAWADANTFFDELNGTNYFANLADWEQRFFQRGMLGFAPREFEAVQAFQMYQRGWSDAQIYERVAEIGRYGLGRTNAERSANFVFFPFSFSKKLLNTLGDFIFQTPGRNLLIHEGLRRYHDSQVDDEFHSLIEDRLPLLEQLWLVNNLAFGASVGRFFFEGFGDRRTGMGQAAQVLASFFVPSGSATPLQQAFGAAGDLSAGLFTPVVITGESISRAGGIDGLDDILRRYIPMAREIERWATTLNDQKVAAISPQHLTPYAQFREYMEGTDAVEASIQPMATAMGYSTVEGFLGSPLGMMWNGPVDEQKEDLRRQFPQGFDATTVFENQAAIDAAALQDLARKPNKSDGEEAFLELLTRQSSLVTMSEMMPGQLGTQYEQSGIRAFALRWVHDPRFAELYDRFLTRIYGPIRRTA